MSEVTVKQLDDLIAEIVKQEAIIDQKHDELTVENKKLFEMQGKAVAYMKELERDEYDTPHGKAKIKQDWTVRNPETDDDKRVFFDHLRERGIFDKYATVNNRSLNSLYKADWEEAKKRGEGMEFSMPGLRAPTLVEKFDIKTPRKRKAAPSGE